MSSRWCSRTWRRRRSRERRCVTIVFVCVERGGGEGSEPSLPPSLSPGWLAGSSLTLPLAPTGCALYASSSSSGAQARGVRPPPHLLRRLRRLGAPGAGAVAAPVAAAGPGGLSLLSPSTRSLTSLPLPPPSRLQTAEERTAAEKKALKRLKREHREAVLRAEDEEAAARAQLEVRGGLQPVRGACPCPCHHLPVLGA